MCDYSAREWDEGVDAAAVIGLSLLFAPLGVLKAAAREACVASYRH